jgi:uncharacterized protein
MMLDMPPDPAERDADYRTPSVTVSGDAIIRAEPDEAVLWVTLSKLDDAPGAALSDVSARSNALVGLLDELGVARPDRSTTGVTVYEDFDRTKAGRRSLGHRAVSRVSVRLTDPEVIGRLIAQATDKLAARIDGPRWQIARTNPLRLEAAKQAAADAQRKAQAYAAGVGAELGRLIRLIEPGSEQVMAGRARGRALPAESMPVERGEQEVAASIHATFALDLG